MFDWITLLNSDRYDGNEFFERKKKGQPGNPKARDHIHVFQEDIERIIYSPAFRRLQGKTQVHPLPKGDFQRNRLTHSLEVGQIGRLLTTAVFRELQASKRISQEISIADISDMVYAACLVHDIGNPPFGHSGEEALQSWFMHHSGQQPGTSRREIFGHALTDDTTKFDFFNLDGNACGYRVISRTQNWRNRGGLRLSAAVTASYVKYPYSSLTNEKLRKSGKMTKKKFGFFSEDEDHFAAVFNHVGLSRKDDGRYPRHPLVYLVEAADDICYHATDIEDGVRSGIIERDVGIELLRNCCSDAHIPNERKLRDDANRYLSYLRAGVISTLVDDCYASFVNKSNYRLIMEGNLAGDLFSLSDYKKEIREIENVCKERLYVHREKMELEAGGYQVIYFLLEEFTKCLENLKDAGAPDKMDRKYKNLYFLLPEEVREDLTRDHTDGYGLACLLVDYVTGMSDRFAVDLFKKMSGVGIP